jgi:hypothetical protein
VLIRCDRRARTRLTTLSPHAGPRHSGSSRRERDFAEVVRRIVGSRCLADSARPIESAKKPSPCSGEQPPKAGSMCRSSNCESAAPTEAAAELLAYVGRLLETHGYSLQSRTSTRIVFARRRRRTWLQPARFVLPLRLLARLRKHETVSFELHGHGTATTIVASGQAPPEVRRALAALEG